MRIASLVILFLTLTVYRSNPNIVIAIVEHGVQPRPNEADYNNLSVLGSGIYRSEDGGQSWNFVNRYDNRPFYYSQIRINPLDDQRVYVLTTRFMESGDGGKTFKQGGVVELSSLPMKFLCCSSRAARSVGGGELGGLARTA